MGDAILPSQTTVAGTRSDVSHERGPRGPRWTHIALPASDIDRSIEWYTRFTPLELLDRRQDADGYSAWLGHSDQADTPFILVLVSFIEDQGKGPQPIMAPFAHIGIEVPTREDVDRIAEQARAEGCLHWPPTDMPDPIGYICAINDPDGNVIEISHNQGVYDKAQQVWGARPSRRAG
jgi:catechol 2,3-dioxygenase-like lactoylglutathione lyase family enzyme